MATTNLHGGTPARAVVPEPVGLIALVARPATILALDGTLTGRSIPECRRAIDHLTALGVRLVLLDLRRTRVERDGPAVLILMRRYAYRRGIRLTLRNAPGPLVDTLARAHPDLLSGTAAPDCTGEAHPAAETTPGQTAAGTTPGQRGCRTSARTRAQHVSRAGDDAFSELVPICDVPRRGVEPARGPSLAADVGPRAVGTTWARTAGQQPSESGRM